MKDICLTINKGEKIALVGLNGSGKTTLLKLLLRFYEPTEGMILVNDQNINNYSCSSLRNKFPVFFQQNNTYALTLEENIKISDWHCDKGEHFLERRQIYI